MHALIEYSPIVGGALNFLAGAIRLAVYIQTTRRPSNENIKTEPRRPDQEVSADSAS